MKQKVVGIYSIGFEDCELVLREGYGGEFYNCSKKGGIPRIKIGADHKNWWEIISILLHEAHEHTMNRLKCRFNNAYELSDDHGSYLFVMDHAQFSDVCSRVACLVSAALPDLNDAWKEWQKAKPKKRKP